MKKSIAMLLAVIFVFTSVLSGCIYAVLPDSENTGESSAAPMESSKTAEESSRQAEESQAQTSEAEPAQESKEEPAAESSAEPEVSSEPESEPEPEPEPEPAAEEVRICRFVYMYIDPEAVTVDGYTVTGPDGNWTMDIHLCDGADDLEKRRGYYEKAVANEKNTDIVVEEKAYGPYTAQTETHIANNQKFGTFFIEFEEPVVLPNDFGTYDGIYCYLWMDNSLDAAETRDVMGEVIGTLTFIFDRPDDQ